MNRRESLKAMALAALLPILPRRLRANATFQRRRPSDAAWPPQAEWQRLNDAVGGNLIAVDNPLAILKTEPNGTAAKQLLDNLKNPFYVGDQPGLTQTMGWVDAWATQASVYAVAARHAQDISEAVNFARENALRLVVKGGGHSYQGTSNSADSLLIWTRHMNDIELHDAFVPRGCEGVVQPQHAVTVGAGTIGMRAYDAVTTRAGRYVQGGGCTTVGLAGLVQGGGFGSFSKRYGLAAAGLLEAEVVTADGEIRIANACTHPDLFWALKGGGGSSFGVVSSMTLRVHDLPEFFGSVSFEIKAASDDAYRQLIREFIGFYREHLCNDHWGEQAHVRADNSLGISMVSCGLTGEEAKATWQPFLDWVARSPNAYSLGARVIFASIPARHFWDVQWWKAHWPELAFPNPNANPFIGLFDGALARVIPNPVVAFDDRPGAAPINAWWKGDGGQVAWFIGGYESLWLPRMLLEDDAQQRLADALFAASRDSEIGLHFNKGLAGATPDALAASTDTAMNPAVLNAFALAIAAEGQGPAYPGIPVHEPSVEAGRKGAQSVRRCMEQLRALVPDPGSYMSESNYFEENWQQSYWGAHHARLAEIKTKYDPDGLFFIHNGVGCEQWSTDGFTKV